jgi:hypothetical protein
MSLDTARGVVRPFVTGTLVLAQIALAGAWTAGMDGAEPAFAALGPFTMMVVTFWFKDRQGEGEA